MRLSRPGLSAAALIAAASAATAREIDFPPRPEPSAEIMILGVFHFEGSPTDDVSRPAEGILGPRRQAELEALAEALAAFGPTRIMVETPRERDADLQSRYAEYRAGGLRDRAGETYQVAMRLADRLGLARLEPVDMRMPIGAAETEDLPEDDPRLMALEAELDAFLEATNRAEAAHFERHTVAEHLALLNAPERLAASHDAYMRFNLSRWHGDNFGGAHVTANWYRRNLFIFQNILRATDLGAAERVLVVVGVGHAPYLRRMAEESPHFTLVEPGPYLAEAEARGE